MKALVGALYKNGMPIKKDADRVVGDLNVSDWKHPVIGRLTKEACLLGDSGKHLLPPMIDVQLVGIFANGFKLRGFEIINGRELAQEWWCTPQI